MAATCYANSPGAVSYAGRPPVLPELEQMRPCFIIQIKKRSMKSDGEVKVITCQTTFGRVVGVEEDLSCSSSTTVCTLRFLFHVGSLTRWCFLLISAKICSMLFFYLNGQHCHKNYECCFNAVKCLWAIREKNNNLVDALHLRLILLARLQFWLTMENICCFTDYIQDTQIQTEP